MPPSELLSLLSLWLPVTLNMLFNRLPWLTSLYFVGRLGKEELAAAALASTVANVTGASIVVGMNSALVTLAAQAVGSSRSSSPSSATPTSPVVYLQRGLFLHYLFTLPIALLWASTDLTTAALLSLDQPSSLAAKSSLYLASLAPGLLGHCLTLTLTPFCQSLSLPLYPAAVAAVVAALHVPANVLFIHRLGYGYLGAAYATSFSQLLGPLLLYCYVFWTPAGRARVVAAMNLPPSSPPLSLFSGFFAAVLSPRGLCQYLSLALPSLLNISEWWASEIAIFWAGSKAMSADPAVALSAMTIYQSINSSCFMVAVGFSVAVSTRVGGFLGANDPAAARKSARLGSLCAACLSGAIGLLLYAAPHEALPSVLTDDGSVIAATAEVVPLLAAYVFADGVQVALSGVMKGAGKQCAGAPIVVVAYWIVALPVAHYLAFERKMEVVGLVSGMTAGTWVHCGLMCVLVCGCVNWKKEAERAAERVGSSGKGEYETVGARSGEEGGGGGDVEMQEAGGEEGGDGSEDDDFFAGLSMKMALGKSSRSNQQGKYAALGINDDDDDDDDDFYDNYDEEINFGEEEEELDVEGLEAMGGLGADEMQERKERLNI